MNPRLDKNQSELGVLVFAASLEMLPHCNRFLDQHVEVLRYLWRKSIRFENA